jgi:hypothetical protein
MTAAICSAAHADASATMNADGCRMTRRRAMRPDGRAAAISAVTVDRIAARQQAAGLGRDRRLLSGQTGHDLHCGSSGLGEKMTPSQT